jgi:hypothetical protein
MKNKIKELFDKASCLTVDDEVISFNWEFDKKGHLSIYFDPAREFQGIPYEEGGTICIPKIMLKTAKMKKGELCLSRGVDEYRITFYQIMNLEELNK